MEPTLARQRIDVRPVTPTIGAEVRGVDLATAPDDDDLMRAIGELLNEHLVLFFRDQHELTDDGQIRFAGWFGPFEYHAFAKPHPDHPEMTVLDQVTPERDGANSWHSDSSFMETPALGSDSLNSLRAKRREREHFRVEAVVGSEKARAPSPPTLDKRCPQRRAKIEIGHCRIAKGRVGQRCPLAAERGVGDDEIAEFGRRHHHGCADAEEPAHPEIEKLVQDDRGNGAAHAERRRRHTLAGPKSCDRAQAPVFLEDR